MKWMFCCLLLFLSQSNIYANNDWIPFVMPAPVVPTVYVPVVPALTYSTQDFIVQKTFTYGWVPYYTTKTIVVEHNGLFCKHKTVTQQPVIEWIFQPIYR